MLYESKQRNKNEDESLSAVLDTISNKEWRVY